MAEPWPARALASLAATIIFFPAEGQGADGLIALGGSPPALKFSSAPKTIPGFSIQHKDTGWWLVSPEGKPFCSLGVNCVGQGYKRGEFDPENPGYAAWQYYPDTAHWADATVNRLKAWGFTTIGGWSDYQGLRQARDKSLALIPVLHMGSTAGAPWWDMWDPKVIQRMEDTAWPQILAVRDDPRLLGYYTDNELGWWNAALFKMTLEQAPASGQRKRLLKLLREAYKNDWNNLLKDFQPEKAARWRELERGGMLYLQPGGNGLKVMRRFLELAAQRYYQLAHDIIRKYDQRGLILGDRYQSFYYPEVARASAPYVDAVSSNLNAAWNDGTFPRFYLDTLHALTGKPILISEFYLAAAENRTGNRNAPRGFPVAATQRERAAGMAATLRALLRLPYVIGADWFQFADEPRHGREDGENYNFGLVDIFDQPYAEVTSAPAALNVIALKAQPAGPRLDASAGVPPAPADPLGSSDPIAALKAWDRERGFIKPASEYPLADLHICWSPQALYVGLYALDFIEEPYYAGRSVPKIDRPVWEVQGNGQTPIRVRLGANRDPLVSDPEIRVHAVSGLNQKVYNTAIVELPARKMGREQFKAGDTLEFLSTLRTHGQAYRMEWKGKYVLSAGLKTTQPITP